MDRPTLAAAAPLYFGRIKDFQARLTDYLTSRKSDLMARIAKEKALSDPLTNDLKAAVTDFKQTYK